MFANRRDGNATLLLKALEKLGFDVVDLSRVGGGVPDAIVGRNDHMLFVEIKSRDSRYGKQGLSDSQAIWVSRWKGPKPVVAYEVQDVVKAFDAHMRLRP